MLVMDPKRAKKIGNDRHKHKMVGLRLHPDYLVALESCLDKSRRSQSEEMRIALEKHFKDCGVPFTRPAE